MLAHLYKIERLNNSVNGNPRAKLHTDLGVFVSSSDSMFMYGVESALNKQVQFELTRSGRVRDLTVPHYRQEEFEVCTVCVHIIANGEFNDGTNAAELAISNTLLRHPDGYNSMSVDDGDSWFSTSPCETCGDEHHGDRFMVTKLTPQ